jgi:hypothetical protein
VAKPSLYRKRTSLYFAQLAQACHYRLLSKCSQNIKSLLSYEHSTIKCVPLCHYIRDKQSATWSSSSWPYGSLQHGSARKARYNYYTTPAPGLTLIFPKSPLLIPIYLRDNIPRRNPFMHKRLRPNIPPSAPKPPAVHKDSQAASDQARIIHITSRNGKAIREAINDDENNDIYAHEIILTEYPT